MFAFVSAHVDEMCWSRKRLEISCFLRAADSWLFAFGVRLKLLLCFHSVMRMRRQMNLVAWRLSTTFQFNSSFSWWTGGVVQLIEFIGIQLAIPFRDMIWFCLNELLFSRGKLIYDYVMNECMVFFVIMNYTLFTPWISLMWVIDKIQLLYALYVV